MAFHPFWPLRGSRRARDLAFAAAWRRENRRAASTIGPLWVVLGDSTSQGIGASRRSRGFVHQVLRALQTTLDPTWRVVNLSQAGATAGSLVQRQLPALRLLPPANLVTCAVGINDLLRTDPLTAERDFHLLVTLLPPGTLLANIPRGQDRPRSERLNDLVSRGADQHGLVLVDLWRHTEAAGAAALAPDRIHPTDLGYGVWSRAFGEALQLEPPPD